MDTLHVVSGILFWLTLLAFAVFFVSMVIFVGRGFANWWASGSRPTYDDLFAGPDYASDRTRILASMITFVVLCVAMATLEPITGLLVTWYSMLLG